MWQIREWQVEDVEVFCSIWNEVVESGDYYMGEEALSYDEMKDMCQKQTRVCCVVNEQGIVGGFYILHPNQIGRGAHIANATYAVDKKFRGCGLGRILVKDSISKAKAYGFKGFQFNAVVATNKFAIKLYRKLGFNIIGVVPEAFKLKSGELTDLYIMFMNLK
nr:GNAT family N-acetyltransferase [uncultured Cellulosilyticum sp.]